MSDFKIRTANRRDMDYIVGQARHEGWNPGLADADCFYATDPAGFFIGELAGRPIGCVSAVRYPGDGEAGDFGFVGCYIVEAEYRGHYYGPLLGKHAIAALAGCNIGLDGVLAQQEHYRHAGFRLVHRNLRYAGEAGGWPAPEADAALVDALSLPFEQLAAYDREHFPAPRPVFLRHWLEAPGHRSLAYLDGGVIRGYATLRPCFEGYKIGPLFAATPAIAETLLRRLLAAAPAAADGRKAFYLDISEENAEARALVDRLGMVFVFETARMYSGPKPALRWDEVYGITSFELG